VARTVTALNSVSPSPSDGGLTAWTVRAVAGPVPDRIEGQEIPATVPGTIHTDLWAAGLIPDPFLDDHERLVAWVGRCDWEYRTTFEFDPDQIDAAACTDLVFDGLDTVATVFVNGHEAGRSFNMHRSYRFGVSDFLVAGRNEVVVRFASPVKFATEQSQIIGYRPKTNPPPYNAMRKMACSFGWDWGPEIPTVGIWREVRLETWSAVRLDSVRVEPIVDADDVGRVDIVAELEWLGRPTDDLTLHARVAGEAKSVGLSADRPSSVVFSMDVGQVQRWWPRGRGQQHLYDLEVDVVAGDSVHDQWQKRIGFRTVAWRQEDDEYGRSFELFVNDEPVRVRGMNWIPDDAFPHRISREQYTRRIKQAQAAHVNLLRVWGGGIYEADVFYEICDELGMLTWQDFALACAAYAEEEPLRSEIAAEARENIIRLSPHASLVLWCGNNENYLGYDNWNWQLELEGKTWGAWYYEELFPALVADLNPTRDYIPGSPFSSLPDTNSNDPSSGTMHIWDVWNQLGYQHYRDHIPRFAAELGWQAPPNWATLKRSISDDPLTPESPGMLVHQKAQDGNTKLLWGLLPHFKRPDDMATWNWAMQLNQARAFTTAVEHFRSYSPRCSGVVLWQLNDCWPVTSWAVIDGDGREKMSYFAVKQAYEDRIVSIQPRTGTAGGLSIVLVNDDISAGRERPWNGELLIRRLDFSGKEIVRHTERVEVAAHHALAVEIPASVALADVEENEFLVASLGHVRGTWFYAAPRDSHLQVADLDVQLESIANAEGTHKVTITAENLVRDVAILADCVHPDATVDQNLMTLLPGESTVFTLTLPSGVDLQEVLEPGVIRSANDLV